MRAYKRRLQHSMQFGCVEAWPPAAKQLKEETFCLYTLAIRLFARSRRGGDGGGGGQRERKRSNQATRRSTSGHHFLIVATRPLPRCSRRDDRRTRTSALIKRSAYELIKNTPLHFRRSSPFGRALGVQQHSRVEALHPNASRHDVDVSRTLFRRHRSRHSCAHGREQTSTLTLLHVVVCRRAPLRVTTALRVHQRRRLFRAVRGGARDYAPLQVLQTRQRTM